MGLLRKAASKVSSGTRMVSHGTAPMKMQAPHIDDNPYSMHNAHLAHARRQLAQAKPYNPRLKK